MKTADMKLWSGLHAPAADIDVLLEKNMPDLEEWRKRVRAAIPKSEIQDVRNWGHVYVGYGTTEEYSIVAAVACAALNRPDRDPEQVLKLLEHNGTSRGLFLEAQIRKQA